MNNRLLSDVCFYTYGSLLCKIDSWKEVVHPTPLEVTLKSRIVIPVVKPDAPQINKVDAEVRRKKLLARQKQLINIKRELQKKRLQLQQKAKEDLERLMKGKELPAAPIIFSKPFKI